MNFTELRTRDAELGKIAPGIEKLIPVAVVGDPLATSAAVISHLVTCLESLKNGHLALAEVGNAYAANVVLRVFLEHLLKATAVFLEGSNQRNELAEGYLRLAEAEAKAYLKALEDAGIEENAMSGSPMSPLFPKGNSLTRAEKDKIEAPFKYKTLIKMIRDDLGPTADAYLLKIIPNYSELSGFVHGGPSTSLVLNNMDGLQEQKLLQDAELVISSFYSVKRYLLMLAKSLRPQFAVECDRLDEAIESLDR